MKITRYKNEFFIPVKSFGPASKISDVLCHVPFVDSYCFTMHRDEKYLAVIFTLSGVRDFSGHVYCDYVLDKYGDDEKAYGVYHKIPFYLYPYRVIRTLYLQAAHKGFYAPLE